MWASGWAAALSGCGGGGASGGQPQRVELSVSVTGSGRVSSQPSGIDCGNSCRSAFEAGSSVTLTATPAQGQAFEGWSGACSGAALSCTLTLSSAQSATARFQALLQGGWGELLRVAGAGALDPVVALDDAGRATAAWRRAVAGSAQHQLWAARATASGSWSEPVRLDTNVGDVTALQLSVERFSGMGMLVWIEAGATVDLQARALHPDTGWEPARPVETASGMVGVSSVGVDPAGHALAVWSQIGPGGRFSIHANRFLRGLGWGTPVLIETNEALGTVDGDPKVVVLPTGDAVAVWRRSGGSWSELWSNRFGAGGAAWGTANQVVADSGSTQFIGDFDLAADAGGRAMLVWGQLDVNGGGGENAIWFKRFSIAGWQSNGTRLAPPVLNNVGFISRPWLRLNGGGRALVAWLQRDNSLSVALGGPEVVFEAPFTLRAAGAASWTAPPALGLDGSGNAMLVWSDPDSRDLRAARRPTGGAWLAATDLESFADPALGPALAMGESGRAVLAWPQLFPSTGSEIVLRRYSPAP